MVDLVKDRSWTVVGAGIGATEIEDLNLIVADGAMRACLERGLVPEIIVTDLDGYMDDLIGAFNNGSNIIAHGHGDNIAQFYHCLLYTSPSPRDQRGSRVPASA